MANKKNKRTNAATRSTGPTMEEIQEERDQMARDRAEMEATIAQLQAEKAAALAAKENAPNQQTTSQPGAATTASTANTSQIATKPNPFDVGPESHHNFKPTKEEKDPIKTVVDQHIYKQHPILPDKDTIIEEVMDEIYNKLDPKPSMSYQRWKNRYTQTVGSLLNATRSYVTGQIKNGIVKSLNADGVDDWPELDHIRACATRTIKLVPNDPNNVTETGECNVHMRAFILYWDVILGHISPPNAELWAKGERHYEVITRPESTVTPAMEALALFVCENNWNYWQNWRKLQVECPGKKLMPVRTKGKEIFPSKELEKKYKDGKESDWFVDQEDDRIIRFFGPDYNPPYTNTKCGSSTFGGVTIKGKKRFLKLRTAIKKGRKLAGTAAKEQLVLKEVRDKNKVTATNQEEEPKKKRARKSIEEGANLKWTDSDSEEEFDGTADDIMALLDPTEIEGV